MAITTEVPACGRCGSTALHHQNYGKPSMAAVEEARNRPDLRLAGCVVGPESWSTECLTCGQRQYLDDNDSDDDDSEWTTGTRPDTAALVTRYAKLVRRSVVDTATAPAVSYFGLWLLLARLAPVASGSRSAALHETIGVSCDGAAALAVELLAAEHPTIATAFGAWSRKAVTEVLPVPLGPMPDQAGLDRWADEHTRGLIKQFPAQVDPETLLVFATALVLEPRWLEELDTDDDGLLMLDDGLQTIVDTEAAGRVAVAKPFSLDGVDVVSVIAAKEFSPAQVWEAVDEVVAKLNAGALWHGELRFSDGHAWTTRRSTETFVSWDAPREDEVRWRSHLPPWKGDTLRNLHGAPGVSDIAAALCEAEPELAGPIQWVQSATAAYDEYGFTAAAVTATVLRGCAPEFVKRTVHRVDVTFDRPHAVVAIARGGPWEGVPVFHAWVTPDAAPA